MCVDILDLSVVSIRASSSASLMHLAWLVYSACGVVRRRYSKRSRLPPRECGPAVQRVLQFFKYEHSSALTVDEPIPVFLKRTACALSVHCF
jgi:hypothetical protein